MDCLRGQGFKFNLGINAPVGSPRAILSMKQSRHVTPIFDLVGTLRFSLRLGQTGGLVIKSNPGSRERVEFLLVWKYSYPSEASCSGEG